MSSTNREDVEPTESPNANQDEGHTSTTHSNNYLTSGMPPAASSKRRKKGAPRTVVVIPRGSTNNSTRKVGGEDDSEGQTPKTATTPNVGNVHVSFSASQDYVDAVYNEDDDDDDDNDGGYYEEDSKKGKSPWGRSASNNSVDNTNNSNINSHIRDDAGYERYDLSQKELNQKTRLVRLVRQYITVKSNRLTQRQLQSIANAVAAHGTENNNHKKKKKERSAITGTVTGYGSTTNDDEVSKASLVSAVESDTSSNEPEKLSRNVYICMVYNFIDGAAFSIWQAQVLQVLLYQIADDSNTTVGLVSGAGGVMQMFAALISGFAGDILPKDTICRTACLIGMIAMVTSLYGVFSLQLLLFYFSSAYIGVYQGFANPASEALFADSVASGRRTDIYSKKYIVQILCYLVGYLMNVLLFLKLGDDWGRPILEKVMYVGLAVHPIAFIPLAMLSTKHALKNNDTLAGAVGVEDGSGCKDKDVTPSSASQKNLPIAEQNVYDDGEEAFSDDDNDTTATVAIFVDAANSQPSVTGSTRHIIQSHHKVVRHAKPRKEIIETAMLELIQEAEYRNALPAQSKFANDIIYGSAAGGGDGTRNMSMSREDMATSAKTILNFFSSFGGSSSGSPNGESSRVHSAPAPSRVTHGPTVRRFVAAAAASHTIPPSHPNSSIELDANNQDNNNRNRTGSVFTRTVAADTDDTPTNRARTTSIGANIPHTATHDSLPHSSNADAESSSAEKERHAFEAVIEAVNAVLDKYYFVPLANTITSSSRDNVTIASTATTISNKSTNSNRFQFRSARTVQSTEGTKTEGGNSSFSAEITDSVAADESRREIVLASGGGGNGGASDGAGDGEEVVLVLPVQRTALEEIDFQNAIQKEADNASGYNSSLPSEDPNSIKNLLMTRIFNNHNIVPYCVVLGDFLQALGSGMTVRFISLYFVNHFDINPILLSCTWIFITCCTAICAQGMNRLSRRVHRIPLMILVRFIGSTLLGYMALVQTGPASTLYVMLGVFICRQCLMNCSFGISRSVVMDYSNKESRAKWSAMESFSNFSWAGSAVVGGVIADAYGYHGTFLVTTCLHYVATLAIIPAAIAGRKLEAVVVRMNREERERNDKEAKEKKEEDRIAKEKTKANKSNGMKESLLGGKSGDSDPRVSSASSVVSSLYSIQHAKDDVET